MSDKEFRVDYNAQNEGPFGNTWHDTEEEARKHAAEFVNAGPPDTLRSAYVSRPVATYYMRHSVSSVEYTPIAAPEAHPGSGHGEIEGDALAEFMKREGATRWWGQQDCPFDNGAHVEVFTRRTGVWPVVIIPEAPLLWQHEDHDLDILAYRVLPSEPASEEAVDEYVRVPPEFNETCVVCGASIPAGSEAASCGEDGWYCGGDCGNEDADEASSEPSAAAPNGFKEWDGGDCPVEWGTTVEVRHRDGGIFRGGAGDIGVAFSWEHKGRFDDIIAYRVVSEPNPLPRPNGEDEPASSPHAEAKLGDADPFLTSLMERGGTWHDGGMNPAPGKFVDIYVPAASTNLGDRPNYLEGQPADAYLWTNWEVAYCVCEPAANTPDPLSISASETHAAESDAVKEHEAAFWAKHLVKA